MGKVISMEEYRAQKSWGDREEPPPLHRPRIKDKDIWSRDYSTFDDIVHGIIVIRQILDYHLHYSEEWKYYLLCLLDYANTVRSGQSAGRLQETVELMKSFVNEEMNVLNRKDMGIVLLLLDLIAKGVTGKYSVYH